MALIFFKKLSIQGRKKKGSLCLSFPLLSFIYFFLGDDKSYHPAPWISGDRMESQPSYIWYWMREGPLKGSISVSGMSGCCLLRMS